MEGRNRLKKIVPVWSGALSGGILAISCYSVMIAGPLAPVLRDRYTVYMIAR